MNILSLRVSTMRGNENLKKNSEVRMERLQVTEEFISEFGDPGRFRKSSIATCFLNELSLAVTQECLRSLNASSSVEDQVNQVRSFQGNAEISAGVKRDLFVAIYLVVPLKHAVRGAIVK